MLFISSKNKKIDIKDIYLVEKNIKKVSSSISAKERIIDFDKLYHKILKILGYNGDFGEILKQNPPEIKNIEKIWELHKTRNKLVHDFDLFGENILNKKSKEYENEIKNLIQKLK